MASRGRVALIALGAGAGVLVLFVFTVWLILAVSDDGLPGGAKVAVVEVEGVIGVAADRGLDTESIIRTLGEYRDDPAVRAALEKDRGLSRVYAGLRREKSIDFVMARAIVAGA